jgi:hypothetical protein
MGGGLGAHGWWWGEATPPLRHHAPLPPAVRVRRTDGRTGTTMVGIDAAGGLPLLVELARGAGAPPLLPPGIGILLACGGGVGGWAGWRHRAPSRDRACMELTWAWRGVRASGVVFRLSGCPALYHRLMHAGGGGAASNLQSLRTCRLATRAVRPNVSNGCLASASCLPLCRASGGPPVCACPPSLVISLHQPATALPSGVRQGEGGG